MGSSNAAQIVEPLGRLALSGSELAAGLRAVAEETASRSLRRDLQLVATRVEQGRALREALEAAPSLCPPHVRELIGAAAESNRLNEVLLALGRHEQRRAATRRRLRSTLLYPLSLLSLLALGSAFLLLFVAAPIKDTLSQFEDAFGGYYDPLLVRSRIDQLVPYRWPLLGVATATVVGVSLLILRGGEGELGAPVRSLPLLGPVWRWTAWSETLDLWALCLRASIPLPQALRLTGRAVGNSGLARQHEQWARGVEQGQSFSDLLRRRSRVVPESVASLLVWGDTQGALAEAAAAAAVYCEERAESQLTFVEAAVPPMAFAALMVGLSYMYLILIAPLRMLQQLT